MKNKYKIRYYENELIKYENKLIESDIRHELAEVIKEKEVEADGFKNTDNLVEFYSIDSSSEEIIHVFKNFVSCEKIK